MKNALSMVWINYHKHISVAITSAMIILLLIPIATYAYFARDLKTKETIMNRNDGGVILLDKNNKPFFTFYEAKYKDYVPLSLIPDNIKHAIIASEDKDFYNHPGFSVRGILRSIVNDFTHTQLGQGGSTLTQQLVKNALLTPKKSFLRKYQELVLANEIERRYSKNEILEMYLNSVYFGQGAFGIEEAAHVYFGKQAKQLTLAEASVLTSILPAPSALSPFNGNEGLTRRKEDQVLQNMLDQHYITQTEKTAAENEKLVFDKPKEDINNKAPHFALMVRDELIKKYGEELLVRSGYKVKTTINLEWQEYAEKVVQDQVEKLKVNIVSNGAAVVIDPKTGAIVTLVGSKSWYDEKFGKLNIIQSTRQPGSSFKPIVYAEAFERRVISPATLLKDEPTTFGKDYRPVDYDRKYRGKVLPRRALANSLNIPAVDTISRLGVSNAIEAAQRYGITTIENDLSRYGMSLVLGAAEVKPIELVSAYSTFANGGTRNEPYDIEEIVDKSNTVIYRHQTKSEEVISPQTAFLISSILSDNAARQEEFGNTLAISRPAAVKTGTTDDYKDAWTLGYTPSITIGVWVGNNDGTPMDRIAGSLGAAPIWKLLMEKFLSGTPVEQFTPPDNVVKLRVCPTGSKEATPSAYMEYFVKGSQPSAACGPELTPSVSPSPSTTLSPTPKTDSAPSPTSGQPTATPSPSPTTGATPTPIVTVIITIGPTATPTPKP